MKQIPKAIRWAALATAVIGALLVLLAVLAPRLLDTESFRAMLTERVFRELGGSLSYRKLDLDLLPSPGVRLLDADLHIPDKARINAASILVTPRIAPLLRGRLEIGRVDLDSGAVQIALPAGADRGRPGAKPPPPKELRQQAAELVAAIGRMAPDITLRVEDSRFELTRQGGALLRVEDVDGRLDGPPQALALTIDCRSDMWAALSVSASLNAETLAGTARIRIDRLRYKPLQQAFFPEAPLPVREATLNLDASLEAADLHHFRGKWSAALPDLKVRLRQEEVALQVRQLNGSFEKTEKGMHLSVSAFELADPALILSAALRVADTSPRISVETVIPAADLAPLRALALQMAGDDPDVTQITDIVRSGRALDTSIRLAGDSRDALGAVANLRLRGRLEKAHIAVPELELNLTGAGGTVSIADGVLDCEEVAAEVGKSGVSRGRFRLGLLPQDDTFRIEADVAADLGELPGILNHTLTDPGLLEALRKVDQAQGRATGRLVLGDTFQDLEVHLTVEQVAATLSHRAVPFPIRLNGGPFSLGEAAIDIGSLSARIGQSSIEKLSGTVGLSSPFPATLAAAAMELDLAEILTVFHGIEALLDESAGITALSGKIAFTGIKMDGPAAEPNQWRLQGSGSAASVVVDSRYLPQPLTIRSAEFRSTLKEGTEEVSFENAAVKLLDGDIGASGRAYRKPGAGWERFEMAFSGRLADEATRYLSHLLKRPRISMLRSPVAISAGELGWEKDADAITARADLQIAEAPALALSLQSRPGLFAIQGRLGRPADKLADFGLDVTRSDLHLAFNGEVDGTVIEQLVSTQGFPRGRISGDFNARIQLDKPSASVATGRLEIHDAAFPVELPVPVRIQHALLAGQGNRLLVEDARILFQDQPVTLSGAAEFGSSGIHAAVNLDSDTFDLTPVVDALEAGAPAKEDNGHKTDTTAPGAANDDGDGGQDRPGFENLPVSGQVRINVGRLSYDRFYWKPFRGVATLRPGGTDLSVTEARLCEAVSTPGKLAFTPEGVSIDFTATASRQPLQETLACLEGAGRRMSGTCDLAGVFKGRGTPRDLVRRIEGNVELVCRNGRIYQESIFADILKFLSITELLTLRLPDLGREGFGYYSLSIDAALDNGKARVSRSVLDAQALDIALAGEIDYLHQTLDLKGLVAPLKTVSRIMKMVPFVGEAISDTLTTIPIQATGSWDNPKVETAFMSSIAPGLEGVLRNLGKQESEQR